MSGTNGSGIVQKGYGKIRWLDMLGHRIFPRHFWIFLGGFGSEGLLIFVSD
jgi:hypothetical protein